MTMLKLTYLTGNFGTAKKKTMFFRSFKLIGLNLHIFTKPSPASSFLNLTILGLYLEFLELPCLHGMPCLHE